MCASINATASSALCEGLFKLLIDSFDNAGGPKAKERATVTGPEWRKLALEALDAVLNTPEAQPFAHPVSEEDVPGYHTIVSDPMDLGLVRKRVETEVYPDPAAAVADIKLVRSLLLDLSRLNRNLTLFCVLLEEPGPGLMLRQPVATLP